MTRTSGLNLAAVLIYFGLLNISTANATTKGLNQIVTPDIQPDGTLSVSFQQVDPNVSNRYQIQLEYGITKRFETAVFQGYSPNEQVLNAEYGIIQQKSFLLSTGFANWSTLGTAPQPYVEAGYMNGQTYSMIGAVDAPAQVGTGYSHQLQSVLGYAYHLGPKLLAQLDYQAGAANFSTAGFTYSITPQLQLNPAIYASNSVPHKGFGYVVLTWNISVHS